MNIEISKHGLNFGEDLEYIGTFIKVGKSKKINVDQYRLLVRGVKTGKEMILFISYKENFFKNPKCSEIEYVNDFKYITPTHLKNQNYNYYYLNNDLSTVDEFFTVWKNHDPMISVGNYTHNFMSDIEDYTWTYKFNNKQY